ncbi:chromosome condensation protein CrcB [Mycobacterium sp. pW049]|uniref:chromosome condensation protein CrcB n=1 Tax=[Mycobacterium] bulgaricum TaxID=3238985 RepID=UPI00351AF3D2
MALIVGGTAGALLRYALATTWPHPHQVFVSTVLTVGVAFTIAVYLLAANSTSLFASLVLGVCASAASLSAWAVLTISAPMKLSLAFLILTPTAAVGGVLCGLAVARAVAR